MKTPSADFSMLLHSLRRYRWRWLTPPKIDFWPCWIGLLFPISSASAVMGFLWTRVGTETWMKVAAALSLWSIASFLFRWLTAPKYRHTYKQLIVAIAMNRTITVVSLAIVIGGFKGVFALFLVFSTYWTICDMFESAYIRSVERQLPAGVAEYEGLEGPSLGL